MNWKPLFRSLADWTLPPAVQQTVRTAVQRWKTTEPRDLLAANRALHQRHRGERCFIIATGPSIAMQDLKPLAGEVCIGVSNFFVHPDYEVIRPRYHCIASYHAPITQDAWLTWMREMDAKIGNAALFMSAEDRALLPVDVFEKRQVYYTFAKRSMTDQPPMRSIDLTRSILSPQSVTILALQIAVYMGFTSIYLLGVDHNWILNLNTSTHFYPEDQHALNRHGYNEWSETRFESILQEYALVWAQYKFIANLAKGVKIFNATDGGLLDVFPRADLRSLFQTQSAAGEGKPA